MTELTPRLIAVFTNSKPACFGQFIVDIPATATQIYGPTSIDGRISFFPDESNLIDDHIRAKLVEIEEDREILSKDAIAKLPLFGKSVDGAIPGHRLVFGSLEQIGYTIYSFIPLDRHLYVQSINYAASKEDTVAELNRVAKHLRLRQTDEIPSEVGTCIDGGFVGFQPEYEHISFGIRLAEFPDVHFSIQLTRNHDHIPEGSDLKARLNAAESDGGSWYSRVKYLRLAPRQLGSWQGDEALALKPAQAKEKESHEFHFISMGAPNDSLLPRISIQMDTGANNRRKGAVKPSLTDEEAIALWDKLTSSIRIRPTGAAQGSTLIPPITPSQTRTVTGALCPETGWWECAFPGSVEGGKRRHFVEGEPLPYIVVAGNPNLWQKLTRELPSRRTTTIWELVSYDSAKNAPR